MYREIAKDNRKKLDKISFKIRVYEDNTAVDFFYKNQLYMTILTNELDEETICKYMIMVYNNYIKHKMFGKKKIYKYNIISI